MYFIEYCVLTVIKYLFLLICEKLVTLLLCNAMANEALPIFLDEIVPSKKI